MPTLIDQLASPDTDTETRVAATAALGMIGNRKALMPLVAALRSRTVPVRMAAARALGRLGDRARRSLPRRRSRTRPVR